MDDFDDTIPNLDEESNRDQYHHILVEFLRDNRSMKQTAQGSLKQGLWAGAGAVAGGVLLGPIGGLVGGISGSLVGFLQSNQYDGAIQQIVSLQDPDRKQVLIKAVLQSLVDAGANRQNFELSSFPETLASYAASNPHVREQIWSACATALEG